MGHLFIDNTFYFITCSTFGKIPHFNTNEKKRIILTQFNKIKQKLKIPLYGYSISSDHNHSLWTIKNAREELPKIARYLQGGSAFLLNKKRKSRGRIWGKYYAIAIEKEFVVYRVYGYIIGNLLKHDEVKNFNELARSPFSSFKQAINKYGIDGAKSIVLEVINLDDAKIIDPH